MVLHCFIESVYRNKIQKKFSEISVRVNLVVHDRAEIESRFAG